MNSAKLKHVFESSKQSPELVYSAEGSKECIKSSVKKPALSLVYQGHCNNQGTTGIAPSPSKSGTPQPFSTTGAVE